MSFILNQLSVPYINTQKSDIFLQKIEFEKGKKYHVLAPSGTGKTSLMYCMYGLNKSYKGEILFDNNNIATYNDEQLSEFRSAKCSIVFQDMRLLENITAWENLILKNNLTHFATEVTIKDFANTLGVSHTLHRKTHTLSYGEKQRIAIIRSVLQPMRCILLDEPFSHLDENNTKIAAHFLEAQVEKQKATLIICDLYNDVHFSYDYKLIL